MNILSLLKFVEQQVESAINTQSLSKQVHCSEAHFHRQFKKLTATTPAKLVALLRIHRACYLLLYRKKLGCTDIAILCGYQSADGLRRAFKRITGFTPSDFRLHNVAIDSLPHVNLLERLHEQCQHHSQYAQQVTIVKCPSIAVYAIRHQGSSARIPVTVGEFIAWRQDAKLTPNIARTFNAFWDRDPLKNNISMDVMCEAVKPVRLNADDKVFKTVIPAGRYAMLEIQGGDHLIYPAAVKLIDEYLPAHNELVADGPLIVERKRFYPDVPLNESLSQVMVLLR